MWGHVLHSISWLKVQVQIEARKGTIVVHEREIWWCNVGYNIGFEVFGKGDAYQRPVLILKKFNNRLIFGIPLSTQLKADAPYRTRFVFHGVGREALLNQARAFDTKRFTELMGVLPTGEFGIIRDRFVESVSHRP